MIPDSDRTEPKRLPADVAELGDDALDAVVGGSSQLASTRTEPTKGILFFDEADALVDGRKRPGTSSK